MRTKNRIKNTTTHDEMALMSVRREEDSTVIVIESKTTPDRFTAFLTEAEKEQLIRLLQILKRIRLLLTLQQQTLNTH